jgi:hypothetical protein
MLLKCLLTLRNVSLNFNINNVSVKTVDIVAGLPKINFDTQTNINPDDEYLNFSGSAGECEVDQEGL